MNQIIRECFIRYLIFESDIIYFESNQLRTDGGILMAITINIYYSGINGNAKKFAEEMIASGVVEDIRAEKGNLKYEYFFPMEDAETVLLIDSWTDQNAIDIHHESQMMAKITDLREKYDLHMKIERYITDETGIPKTDSVFIRK